MVVGADGGEETTLWHRYSKDVQLTHFRPSGYSLSTPIEWNQTYGGNQSDHIRSIEQTSDGGYIAVGFTRSFGASNWDFWLIKTGGYGNVEWNKTYGGASTDAGRSVQQTSDGGYIAVGLTMSDDLWLVKTDAYGNMEWNKTYGGSGYDDGYSVEQTSDGGYIVAGATSSYGAGSTDYWLLKTDVFGELEWNKTYGGNQPDGAHDVHQTSDGGYIVVGRADSFKTGIFDGEIWLVKTDEYGNVSWGWLSGWPDWDFADSVEQTSDGGYIVAGTRFSSYDTRYDFWLLKFYPNGTLDWNSVYARSGTSEDVANSVQQTSDGGYVVAGGWGDFWLVKTDGAGNVEWNKSYGGAGSETAYSVQQTSDGGYIAAGDTTSFGLGRDGYPDGWLVKIFPAHDVAVNSAETSKTVVGQGYPLSINVTVENPGFFTEAFNVTVYANATVIGTQTVQYLSSKASATLVFTWNTTGFDKGNYTISAYVTPVSNETITTDNALLADREICVTIPGDVDADQDVDIYDIVQLAGIYGTTEEDPKYNPNCDIDGDGDIDIYDIVAAAGYYGESW